jgi:hypothetical protein
VVTFIGSCFRAAMLRARKRTSWSLIFLDILATSPANRGVRTTSRRYGVRNLYGSPSRYLSSASVGQAGPGRTMFVKVREIATKADPFTKKRLLELANRYERNTTRRVTPLPAVAVRDHADDQQGGGDNG